MDQPVILSVDTATPGGSVSLARGDELLATRIGDPTVSHSNSLLKDINECLDQAGLSLGDVDLLAAASGPGSFTGLRIGLATVKALATTLEIPCVGIPTLHAVAHSAGPATLVAALLPAGRGEVFVQLLSVSPDGIVTPLDDPAHLSPHDLIEKYGPVTAIKWSGPAAQIYRVNLEAHAREKGIEFEVESRPGLESFKGWLLASPQENLSLHVAALALQKFEGNEITDAVSLSAIYVRPSDAELKCR